MKKAALILLLVPVIFFSASFTGPFEQIAQADSGGRGWRGGHSGGRDGFVSRGGARGIGGGDAVVRSGARDAVVRGGVVRGGTRDAAFRYSGRDSYVRNSARGGFVGRGSYAGYRGHGHGGHHGGHFSSSIWIGPSFGFGYDPFYYPYYPYRYSYPYPYYAPPTVVVPQEPQEYIMRDDQQDETGYWYYCKEANGYYPYVKRCPGGWMKVVPYQPPPDLD
jgi:hypothetical protein